MIIYDVPPTPNLPLLRKKRVLGMTERFWEQVHARPDGCVVWTGRLTKGGYGLYRHRGKQSSIHRVMYEELVGPIPDGMTLDHLCRVASCIAVDHLEPVTVRENILRAKAAITHCPQGHPYDEANSGFDRSGKRRCMACARERSARERALQRIARRGGEEL